MGVGVPGDSDPIGYAVEGSADLAQYQPAVGLQLRAAAGKHGAIAIVGDLNAQALAGDVEQNLLAIGGQCPIVFNCLPDASLEVLQALCFPAQDLSFCRLKVDGSFFFPDLPLLHLSLSSCEVLPTAFDDAGAVA